MDRLVWSIAYLYIVASESLIAWVMMLMGLGCCCGARASKWNAHDVSTWILRRINTGVMTSHLPPTLDALDTTHFTSKKRQWRRLLLPRRGGLHQETRQATRRQSLRKYPQKRTRRFGRKKPTKPLTDIALVLQKQAATFGHESLCGQCCCCQS